MNIRLVLDVAPPTPACYPDRVMWAEYLLAAHLSRKVYGKPFVNGVFNPDWSYCKDCNGEHKALMQASSKCQPNKFHKERHVGAKSEALYSTN
jgi:hypothetical protein